MERMEGMEGMEGLGVLGSGEGGEWLVRERGGDRKGPGKRKCRLGTSFPHL